MNITRQLKPQFYEPVVSPEGSNAPITLVDVQRFLTRQWRLIAICTIFGIAIGAVVIALSPIRYTAKADMLIDTKRMTWTQSELATENRFVEDASVESEIETTKSEKLALAVIKRLRLTEDPEFVGPGRQLLKQLLTLFGAEDPVEPAPTDEELTAQALAVFKSNLRVTRLGRSYIETIAYTSLDPEKAAKIANAITDAYVEDQLQARFDATRRASVWLQERIGELRQQASNAYKEVQDFKSANSIIMGADGKLASEVELDQLGAALAKARADTTQALAKFERISRVLEQRSDKQNFDIPDPVVTDALSNPVITRLRQQFLDNQSKENDWASRYGPDHQAARNLRSEMAALHRAIWDEVTRIAESYRSELQIARSQEESIDRRMLEVFQKSANTRQSQVRLKELETAANTYRGIYETFLNRFTQSVQQQSFPSTEARIVTVATPPRSKSAPKSSLIVALATMCGLSLGVVGAFVRERLSQQVHTRAQLEELLGVSCLAALPEVKGTAASRASRSGRRSGAAFRVINNAAPLSATAEALRYIKVAVDLSSNKSKIIGFASALPGEGKTTVAASFASFLAASGARTLLIDADLRNPSITRLLGYTGSSGLAEIALDGADYKNLLISDSNLKFDFLPAAAQKQVHNSSEILTSQAVRDVLKQIRADYEYVIVDLPPILPVVDVKASAHLFDGFVLVVEWGSTSADEIVKATSVVPVFSERLLGTVLNKADERVMRRFEGYSSRHYEYYTTA